MYQFCYTLSEHEYFEFNIHHAFNSPTSKKNMLFYHFVPPFIFVICGLFLGTIVEEPVTSCYFYVAFGIVAILWFTFYKWIMIKIIKKNIKRFKKSGYKLPYENSVIISFEDEYFVETTEKGDSRTKYSAIELVVSAEKAIYIYINAVQAIILPFTVFSDEQKRNDFLVFIEGKMA